MGMIFGGAFPVLPGKSDRVRNFAQELAPHRAEWDRLSKEGTFRFYDVRLQESPAGDIAIYTMEFEDPSRVRTTFTSSPHDRWWVSYMRDVHGVDVSRGSGEGTPSAFTWWSDAAKAAMKPDRR
jgi:hypothetical protein